MTDSCIKKKSVQYRSQAFQMQVQSFKTINQFTPGVNS